jgi:hypothetical protein
MVVLSLAALPARVETKLASDGKRSPFGTGLAGGEDLHDGEG